MANFTEQATLKVIDRSSATIRKINAELSKLQRTARSIKSTTINIRVNTGNLQAANRQLNTLAQTMRRVGRLRASVQVNTAGLQAANNQIARLRAQSARSIII